MHLRYFENEYWQEREQSICFRHLAALKLIEKGPVLDLGCGDGLFLEMLREKGIEGFGLDISEVAIEKAKKKGLNVRQFDFSQSLPFQDNSFETVVLLDVLEHLYQPDKVLKEVYRVTKRNLILSVPNFNSLPARFQVLMGKVPENNKPRQGHIYWISYSVIKDLLRKNNFKIEEVRVNSFFSSIPGLKSVMQFLAKVRPSLFALSFVIKARKL